MTNEKPQDTLTVVFMTVILLIGLWLAGMIAYVFWQGVSTAARVKEAQKQALEHTIEMNHCKTTGYVYKSDARVFLCDDGETYREDRVQYTLERIK
jgi:archaellum component FlaF (FlaF/FlaG flagellin family)